ncbi:MAG: type I DNA topoisomerase, partial [Patescibacteria group bacterium]|nr:type I DNA topoisomerase [Patescibacteria group bacterium]
MKKVLIVESPSKAKTITQYLGKDFSVYASFGHVRDLPKTNLGVDVENDFEPKYTPMRKKAAVIKMLKQATKGADVYLATDFDREGEAIAWHLGELLKLKEPKRITFHEITKHAITEAVEKPREILIELVDAQKARRIIDRLFGYKLSPLLWKKLMRGLSAGRVQSAALRLIVQREKEIRDFKSDAYYKLVALFKEQGMEFEANLEKIDNQKIDKLFFKNQKEIEGLKEILKARDFKIAHIISRPRLMQPPAPYITATLQQDAFRRLRFTAKKTMFLAQGLYEGVQMGSDRKGLITYMRTDSPTLAREAQIAARKYIDENLGKEFLPEQFKIYKARKGAQEAHEAIRPTDFSFTPDKAKNYLEKDQHRLYELIFNRTIASQCKPAEFRENIIELEAKAADYRNKINKLKYTFIARGLKDVFLSFIKFYSMSFSLNMLPQLKEKTYVKPKSLNILNLETKPRARYTEATLVKALERLSIGRPSTYAPIIDLLYYRHYIERQQR